MKSITQKIKNNLCFLKTKLIIMAILYLFCNYLIWFGLDPCISYGRNNGSFWTISTASPLFYPLYVVLPVVLFQPHMLILYREKPLTDKKHKRIFWSCSALLSLTTLVVWSFIVHTCI